MARVLTNHTGIIMTREQSRGVLPGSPTWKVLEPNNITNFGPQITTVARSPISKLRQRRKGTPVDLDSDFEYECDLTVDVLVDFIEGFVMATAVNSEMTFRGANVGASGYTIPAASAGIAAKLQYTAAGPSSLVYGNGYANAANNGLKILTADTAAAGTTIAFAGSVVETAPTNAEVSIAGIRAEAGDIACTVSAGVCTLTSGNGASVTPIDFTTLGWTKGQRVHIGGLLAANRFGATVGAGSNDSYGSGRIRTIAAGTVTLDKLDATLLTSDGTDTGSGGTEVPVDLLWGRFIRNVSVDSSEYLEQYFQFEAESPNFFETEPPTPVADPDGFEYSIGNLANKLDWNMPLTDKATLTVGFVGTDTEVPVDNGDRKTNAASALLPLFTGAFNTSSDFLRLRIAAIDDTGITSDFKDVVLSLNNNASGEKVLGFFGSKYINVGNFDVDAEMTALFTNPEVPSAIRENTTVTMDWMLQNDDGAIAADIPSMTLSSDGREYPVNESVRISVGGQAFVDSFFGTSFSLSLFPVYPEAA
jgi:hypothetical protein